MVLFFLLFCLIFSQVLVVFEAKYVSPDDASGNFEPTNLVRSIQQQHNISCSTQSLDDDQQMLLDIEQNIANLERSLNKGECRIKFKKKKKKSINFFKIEKKKIVSPIENQNRRKKCFE